MVRPRISIAMITGVLKLLETNGSVTIERNKTYKRRNISTRRHMYYGTRPMDKIHQVKSFRHKWHGTMVLGNNARKR